MAAEALPVMLAIEISQREGGVALRDGSGRIEAQALSSARAGDRAAPGRGRAGGHDRELMPAVDRLFKRMQLRPNDLRIVAVSIGPGGFTGLRIALSAAKTFGEVLGISLVAVPSALVAVQTAVESPGPIGVALASKRGEFWDTRLDRAGDGHWAIIGTPGLARSDTFDPSGLHALIADAYLPEAARRRCDEAGLPVIDPVFDPVACLACGWRLFQRGETTTPAELLPIYPRPPEAVSLWEKRAEKSE